MELLMGMKAGKLRTDGIYTSGSLFELVTIKLDELRDVKKKRMKRKIKQIQQEDNKSMTLEDALEIEKEN